MLIIFEGLDRCGKDTQIRLLQKHFYPNKMFHHIHCSGFTNNNITSEQHLSKNIVYYKQMFDIILKSSNFNFILNRSHLGEYVYGPLYRNYDASYIWELENYFIKNYKNDIYLFVLIDDICNLIHREDGKSFSTNEFNKQNEIDLFTSVYKKSNIKNKLLINIKNKNIETVHTEIMKLINNEGK